MGILAVLLLGAWVLALAPALARSVGTTTPLESEQVFLRALRSIGKGKSSYGSRNILVPPKPAHPSQSARSYGAPSDAGPNISTAAMRRRRNLTYLAMFIVATFLLGLVPSLRFLLVLNLIADVLLILYLGAVMYLAVWPPATEAMVTSAPQEPPIARPADGGPSDGPESL